MLHLFVALLLAAPPVVSPSETLAAWDARFDRTDGWVGGDGAFTVALTPARTLWLFSDTWVGSVRNGKRTNVVMVNNSVGIQDGDNAIQFAVKKDGDGKPIAVITPVDGKGWFWLFAGFHRAGKLFLFLAHIEKTDGGGAFGFRQVGQWLAVVSNPTDDPTAWKYDLKKLPFATFAGDNALSFGSAVLPVGDDLYVYGFREVRLKGTFPKRDLVVAKVPADKLADFDAWKFLTNDGWNPEPRPLKPLADKLAAEFSVSYLPGIKKYVAIYQENGLSERIVGRFADAPNGPWSEAVLLHTCPEMKADKQVFTYAAKAHPHLATSGHELVISYVVNGYDLPRVLNDATVYRPRFVRVRIE